MHNVLILGSGGREHALGWKIAQSPICKDLYFGPGNAGTADVGENIPIDILDFDAIKNVVNSKQIDVLVVGPEAPLVNGIVDYFSGHHVKVIGPDKAGAELEGSKSFANAFMNKYNIPTAQSVDITKQNLAEGYNLIDKQTSKIVLKADGLAAGKGVLILDDKEEAKLQLKAMILDKKFGEASSTVVIEEFLDGIEFSVFVLTDGKDYQVLPVAKDYKRIGEGDKGLNTGGMGAVSPPPFVDEKLMQEVDLKIIQPTIQGLSQSGFNYKGFVFIGLILVDKKPYVIEYNVRMGDPETEVVIPRLKNDLLKLLVSLYDGTLKEEKIEVDNKTASTIMLVSGGYPEAYAKGKTITISQDIPDSTIFHAGTKQDGYDVLTNGGRVMAVTSFGDNHNEAIQKSLKSIPKIHFDGMHYRKDIGFDL